MSVKESIRTVPLFRLLDDSELDRVCEVAKVEQHPSGEELFKKGDHSDYFYLVVSGRVKIRIPAAPGKEERILYLGQGKFFGEMGVIRNTPRNADAEIQDDAELISISQNDFDQLMSMDEAISKKVMGAYMSRLIELNEEHGVKGSVDDPSSMLFFSTGAGAGASFLCANLAVKIHQLTQKSVLIVDMDLEGPTQHLYGGYGGEVGGLRGLFSSPQITREAIKGASRKLSSGVELLGGPGVPVPGAVTPEIMPEFVRAALRSHYYVLIDTTSAMTPINEALMNVVHASYLAVGPNRVSLHRAVAILERLDELGLGDKVRLFLNKHQTGRGITTSFLEEQLGKKVVGQVRYDDTRCLPALNEGKPVCEMDPKARISAELTRAARQALSLQGGEEDAEGFSIWNLFG